MLECSYQNSSLLHVLLLWPTFPQLLQTTNFDCLGSLKLFLGSSFLLSLAFFGLLGALLITGGSMIGLCKGGHKFGPLHGKTINEYVVKPVDFMSNAIETYSSQNSYQKQQYNNITITKKKDLL